MDAEISCGPEGWRSEDLPWDKESIMKLFEDNRRCPEANWFELVGSLGDDGKELFRIGIGGIGRRYKATKSATLYAFANDLDSKYKNNTGKLIVIIKITA